jgi:hypothetical protein
MVGVARCMVATAPAVVVLLDIVETAAVAVEMAIA